MPDDPSEASKALLRPDKNGKVYFIVGLVLALVIWGLQLVGVTVNVYLGGFVLAVAFGLMAYAFWIWEGASHWHVALRFGTILVAALLYGALIERQVVAELRRENPSVQHTNQPQDNPDTKDQDAKKQEPKPKPKPKSDKPKPDIKVGPVEQGPCSNLQIGSSGSQTVNCGPPPPQFTLKALKENVKIGENLYETDYGLDVQSASTIASLRVRAEAPNIAFNNVNCLRVLAIRDNGIMSGNSHDVSSGVGFCQTHAELISSGKYRIVLWSVKPDTFKVTYQPD
jgi:hypothetical protein